MFRLLSAKGAMGLHVVRIIKFAWDSKVTKYIVMGHKVVVSGIVMIVHRMKIVRNTQLLVSNLLMEMI